MSELKQALGVTTAYGVGQKVQNEQEKLFERYERGSTIPTLSTVKRINNELRQLNGTKDAFFLGPKIAHMPVLPLWSVLEVKNFEELDQLYSNHSINWDNLFADKVDFTRLISWACGGYFDYAQPDIASLCKTTGSSKLRNDLTPRGFSEQLGNMDLLSDDLGSMSRVELQKKIAAVTDLFPSIVCPEMQWLQDQSEDSFFHATHSFIAHMQSPSWVPNAACLEGNPLIRSLEQWRQTKTQNLGFSFHRFVEIVGLFHYRKIYLGNMGTNGEDHFEAFNNYITRRLLNAHFGEKFSTAMHAYFDNYVVDGPCLTTELIHCNTCSC